MSRFLQVSVSSGRVTHPASLSLCFIITLPKSDLTRHEPCASLPYALHCTAPPTPPTHSHRDRLPSDRISETMKPSRIVAEVQQGIVAHTYATTRHDAGVRIDC
jgi:hypothetical protein